MTTPLDYLDFEYSEDEHGVGTFDAMASTRPALVPAVQAEVVQVLAWAHAAFADTHGPVDEGFDWDYDLQGTTDTTVPQDITYDEERGQLQLQAAAPATTRHTLSLSVSGTPEFCEAFRQQFGLD